jgi:hypothetical protein
MSEIEDRKQPESIEIKELPYEKGLRILGLDKIEVEKIGKNINDFFQKISKKRNRSINRDAVIMFKGAIFAIGTKDLNNPEFKEHCSSSLREIFHVWRKSGKLIGLQKDYKYFYKNENTNTININDKLKELWYYYDLFTGIVHHESERWRYAFASIKKTSIEYTSELNELNDNEFIELVKNFFILLKEIFK